MHAHAYEAAALSAGLTIFAWNAASLVLLVVAPLLTGAPAVNFATAAIFFVAAAAVAGLAAGSIRPRTRMLMVGCQHTPIIGGPPASREAEGEAPPSDLAPDTAVVALAGSGGTAGSG